MLGGILMRNGEWGMGNGEWEKCFLLSKHNKLIIIISAGILLLLSSCLGVSADISIRANGSGRIAMEYRVSQMLESAGRLDGNERWPAIPVGRGDFERGIARIPDLRLVSFSAKDAPAVSGGRDLVTKAVLEFNNTGALLAFLDSTGAGASFVSDNGNNLLRLKLKGVDGNPNGDLLALMREISGGYDLRISLSAPKNAGLTAVPASLPSARMVSSGKKVSFTAGMGDILSLDGGLDLEISW